LIRLYPILSDYIRVKWSLILLVWFRLVRVGVVEIINFPSFCRDERRSP
jgi:hypothetical protein